MKVTRYKVLLKSLYNIYVLNYLFLLFVYPVTPCVFISTMDMKIET